MKKCHIYFKIINYYVNWSKNCSQNFFFKTFNISYFSIAVLFQVWNASTGELLCSYQDGRKVPVNVVRLVFFYGLFISGEKSPPPPLENDS